MFQVNVSSQRRYYPLDRDLSFEIKRIEEQHGISEETLLTYGFKKRLHNPTLLGKNMA